MADTKPLILCIEDEAQIRRFLRAALATQGYSFVEACNGAEGLALAASQDPAIIILDLGLPDIDGLSVTRRIREWSSIPIIVLSARGQDRDKVEALDSGADDYLTKPFSVAELLARIRVALRRGRPMETSRGTAVISINDLTIDIPRHRVVVRGEEVKLTPTEFKLLAELANNAGRVLTHQQLLRNVWGAAYREQTHYLRIYMGQLRKKIERIPAQPVYLLSEPGVGYRLADDSG